MKAEPKSRHTSISAWAIPGLVLFPTFFWGLLPRSIVLGAFASAAFLAVVWWVTTPSKNRVGGSFGLRVGWALFGIWAFISHLINADSQRHTVYLFALTVLLMAIGATSKRWIGPAVSLLAIFGLVDALVTVWLSFDARLFDNLIKPRFYPETFGATGYMSGLTPHYSYNATYIVYGLIVVTAGLVFAKFPKHRQFASFIMFLLAAFALVLTSKRAHMLIAVLAIIAIYGVAKVRGKYFKLIFGVLLVSAFGGYAVSTFPGIAASFDRLIGSSESLDLNELTTGRVTLWQEAIVGGNASPIFGQGWSTFYHYWTPYSGASHAHNEFLEVFYSLGYPGVVIFTVLVFSTLIVTFRVTKTICRADDSHSMDRIASATAFSLQAFLVVYGATTGTMFTEMFTFVPYFLSIAITCALGPTSRSLSVNPSPRIAQKL